MSQSESVLLSVGAESAPEGRLVEAFQPTPSGEAAREASRYGESLRDALLVGVTCDCYGKAGYIPTACLDGYIKEYGADFDICCAGCASGGAR
jgi:hypothetical protein